MQNACKAKNYRDELCETNCGTETLKYGDAEVCIVDDEEEEGEGPSE